MVGAAATFVVRWPARCPEIAVSGEVVCRAAGDRLELRLITCGGAFGRVHRGWVEDPVRVGTVIGGAVPVLGEHPVNLGVRIVHVQVAGHLGGTLTGSDHDEPVVVGGRHVSDLGQQLVVVELARRLGDPVGQLRLQPTGENHGARPQSFPSAAVDWLDIDCQTVALVADRHRLREAYAQAFGSNLKCT